MFFVRKCNNETEIKYNIKSKTNDEIIKKFGNIYLDTYVHKNLVNPSDFENPIQQTFTFNYRKIKLHSENIIKDTIWYGDSRLHSDTGFIFSDIYSTPFLEYESTDILESPYQLDRALSYRNKLLRI